MIGIAFCRFKSLRKLYYNLSTPGFNTRSDALTGLEEFWFYNVTIRATTSKGSMESDTITFQTIPAGKYYNQVYILRSW